jgi:hypothetical protein
MIFLFSQCNVDYCFCRHGVPKYICCLKHAHELKREEHRIDPIVQDGYPVIEEVDAGLILK